MFLQICPVCEHRNPRGSRFCNECGSPLQLRFCPACHAAEDVMSLECRTCGAKLPMIVLTDAAVTPAEVHPSIESTTESIWKTETPVAARPPFEAIEDNAAVSVHGQATAPAAIATGPVAQPSADSVAIAANLASATSAR